MMTPSRCWLSWLLLIAVCLSTFASDLQSKQNPEAKRHFDRAKELDSSNDPRAEQEYRLAIEANGGHFPEAFQELSFYLRRRLRFSEAAEALENYMNQASQDDDVDHLDELKGLQRAANLQQRITAAKKPELADLIEFISLVSRYAKLKDGIAYAERAVSLYPTSSEAHVLLARLLIGSGQHERRSDLLRKAVELDPNNPKTRHQLGWYYIEMLRGQESADEFRKALELSNGQLTDAWQGLGWALSQLGQKKEAIEAFRNYLQSGNVPQQYRIKIEQQIEKLERGSQH